MQNYGEQFYFTQLHTLAPVRMPHWQRPKEHPNPQRITSCGLVVVLNHVLVRHNSITTVMDAALMADARARSLVPHFPRLYYAFFHKVLWSTAVYDVGMHK